MLQCGLKSESTPNSTSNNLVLCLCLSIVLFMLFVIMVVGMEAIWKVEVEDFPAFIVVDDKGNDFFKEWQVE